ncbi:Methyltransferase domain-containing protein [Actinokineospora alba]|uniref:Methyltransferase domain-containing protein n=1 Tax=Actinokineospora alba TaxID=504798 RepID=A0A1H0TB11_9PSEU|nr:methyltransferase domain-containing protein [Actinokineospora alba]TDP66267.1 methyltransferase family protein [Actinokineospora alba]SDJ20473.1 Methyltransferase domain-containing protein [Actinokineospora alba]SDP51253.1 Methyltransferase domain-containing protein [Actinokineospora alba]
MIYVNEASEPLKESPLSRLPVRRPVDRYTYVVEQCRGQRVLDLGAYDETEVDREQHASWRWLHAEIAGVAKEVLGVDASPKLKDTGGVETSCGTTIRYGTVENLDAILEEFRPDIIVAGELIEHTQDTLGWLSRIAALHPGIRLVATTPNTTSLINMLMTLFSRENAHPDHIQVYSFRTLATLASRVPVNDMKIVPYYYDPHLFYSRLPRFMAPLVTAIHVLFLKPMQFLFPLSAFGLILDGVLGDASGEQAKDA